MSQPIASNTTPRIAATPSAQAASAASNIDQLRTPQLSPGEVSDARSQLGALRSEPGAASMRRIAEGVALTPDQVADLRARAKGAANLPAVPADVPGKRAWIQQHAPAVQRAQGAALELKNEAFFMNHALKADAEGADRAAQKASAQLVRVEEQAGLRRPEAPLDPSRSLRSAQNAVAALGPPGNLISKLLTPAAALVDVADLASRPLQAAAYPQAKQAYEARLAEYEKARREFPLP